ncbi:putative RNA-directed DNA polymerase from transposon X-element [Trichonephila clavipes]|nr:putative RNA-directed DNA polymerase from transposon X-element [Trichonephila clavipes]
MRHLGDVLDDARFKFTHFRKQEIAEQNKLLQAQIDAWGLPPRPVDVPFQIVHSKNKGRKNSGETGLDSKKAKTDDVVETQNRFSGITINNEDNMEVVDPQEGTSATREHPGVTAPQKKLHVPPITIDNVKNQAALLKHLQEVTKQKLEAKLIGTKFRIYPQTPYSYHQIRRYINENTLESFTYMLPEEKMFHAVIRGLLIDMSPSQIIADIETQGFHVKECHNMQSRKTGQPMPLFMLAMESTEQHKTIFKQVTSIGFVKYCPKPIEEKPTCCLCGGDHPANFLDCPKNPRHRIAAEKEKKEDEKRQKATHVIPEPPKINLWEQELSNLTLVSWNANRIRTRVEEFREFISEWNPDIINLQETHLQPCHQLAFPNYNIYRTDRIFRGGGTAILIKRTIPHHEFKINNQSFEMTAIKIERNNLQPITVISAYRSPRKPIFVHDLHQLFRNQDYVLVAGDLNAKHASWSPIAQKNVAGHTIRKFCDSTSYTPNALLEPTHFHKNLRNTVIDLAICKGMTITDVTSIPELSSDHNPVLFEVCLDNFTAPALSTFAFPNWNKFQDILTNSLPCNPSSFQENLEPYDDDFIDHVEEKVERYMDHNTRRHTAPLTSPQEVMDIILNLNNKKAPGKDGIKNIALKALPLNAITYITKVFNKSPPPI